MRHPGPLLSAYLDGELTPGERDDVVAHLTSCDACKMEMADIHAARSALRSLPVLDLPVQLVEELGMAPNVVPLRRRPVTWVAAAAAAAVVGVAAASIAAPDPIAVSLSELGRYQEQQQQVAPVLAPHVGYPGAAR